YVSVCVCLSLSLFLLHSLYSNELYWHDNCFVLHNICITFKHGLYIEYIDMANKHICLWDVCVRVCVCVCVGVCVGVGVCLCVVLFLCLFFVVVCVGVCARCHCWCSMTCCWLWEDLMESLITRLWRPMSMKITPGGKINKGLKQQDM